MPLQCTVAKNAFLDGLNSLQNITNINRGRYMASQLNGRTGEPMLINAIINDGVLVVWGVANAEDLKTLEKAFKGSVEVE